MYLSRVQLDLEAWPGDRWILRQDPLGDLPFILIEADERHPDDDPEGLSQLVSVLIGGGFTTQNLPEVLRGIAKLVEEQNARAAA